jgi:hypothetical protein
VVVEGGQPVLLLLVEGFERGELEEESGEV